MTDQKLGGRYWFDLHTPHCDRAVPYREAITGKVRYACGHIVYAVFGRVFLLCVLLITGCAPAPRPDPVIITDVAAPLECPEPEVRRVPAHLTAPLVLDVPTLLPAGEGDYGITRAGVEMLIDGYRALREREALWRAWAN